MIKRCWGKLAVFMLLTDRIINVIFNFADRSKSCKCFYFRHTVIIPIGVSTTYGKMDSIWSVKVATFCITKHPEWTIPQGKPLDKINRYTSQNGQHPLLTYTQNCAPFVTIYICHVITVERLLGCTPA